MPFVGFLKRAREPASFRSSLIPVNPTYFGVMLPPAPCTTLMETRGADTYHIPSHHYRTEALWPNHYHAKMCSLLTCDCGFLATTLRTAASTLGISKYWSYPDVSSASFVQSICSFPPHRCVFGMASAYAALLRNAACSRGFEALSPSNFLFLVGNSIEIPQFCLFL